ncbi:uncharacterized protein LOC135399711 [Ornithodoros turicata]|uniref:uncharacterized protein LOC135399711 n=1 Tax=Ornithodoros turicata TaxID=34597 RepID=UPI0031391488
MVHNAKVAQRENGKASGAFASRVFKKCFNKLIGLMKLIDVVEEKWDQFVNVKCFKKALDEGYPDYSQDCVMDGSFGEVLMGDEHLPRVHTVLNCMEDAVK